MALKEIAVQGCTIEDGNPANTTTLTDITVPSLKVKAENKPVYKEKLDFIIVTGSGITGSCLTTAPINDSISSTAIKTKADGKEVMRKDDFKTIVTTGTNPSSGASCPLTFNIKISDAGQTKVKAQ